MYVIKVQSSFNAAHNLRGYRGKCEKLHGHNWKVEVEISSAALDKNGMVLDFHVVKKQINRVLVKLDHSYLNSLAYFKKNNPTSEKIAEFIFFELKKLLKKKPCLLQAVWVWETETAAAIFSEKEHA
ncbi:MAG: 6-carboxytetrahydropterin synthase QueD [Candidatus Omnitrophota bacterium]